MGFQHVSVSRTSLRPDPDEVEVSRKGKDRIAWRFEGNEGDRFVVSIAKGGCFRNSDGTYQVVIRRGSASATIRTDGLRATTDSRSYKYSIARFRNGRVKSVDPRIKIRE